MKTEVHSKRTYIIDLSELLLLIPLHNKSKNYSSKRETLISEEKLHIDDQIDYSRFEELYNKYGSNLDEKEFAQYFLDIEYTKLYDLKRGKNKVTTILSKEYVSPKELEEIKQTLISAYNLTPNSKVSYDMIMEMYEKFGRKLSFRTFVEDILGTSTQNIRSAKSSKKPTTILKGKNSTNAEIEELRLSILNDEALHIGDSISFEKLQELHQKFGNMLSEKIFCADILGIAPNQYNDLKSGRSKTVTILSTYKIDPNYINQLRQTIVLEENLHVNDNISYQEFLQLYKKRGGILPEALFAEEILDINAICLREIRNSNSVTPILTIIEIPEKFLDITRNYIIAKHSLEQNQPLNYKELQKLHKKYGYILSEVDFAELVLDISRESYFRLKSGEYSITYIFKNRQITNFDELKKRVISENKLHYDDIMSYQDFQALHKKYAPNIRETLFAEKILDIKPVNFGDMKQKNCKTRILLDEPLPTQDECLLLKKKISSEQNLHISDEIDYEFFESLYVKYGGITSKSFFANKILDISTQSLYILGKYKNKKTAIFTKTTISQDELNKLKQKIISENNLQPDSQVSLEQIEEFYNKSNTFLSMPMFAKMVLGISRDTLNKLKKEKLDTTRICIRSEFVSKEVSELKDYLIQDLPLGEIARKMGVTVGFLETNMDFLYKSGILIRSDILYKKIEFLRNNPNCATFSNSSTTTIEEYLEELEKQAKSFAEQEARKNFLKHLRLKGKENKHLKFGFKDEPNESPSKPTTNIDRKQALKISKSLQKSEKAIDKILRNYSYSTKDISTITTYISNCKLLFSAGLFPRAHISRLMDSLLYIESDAEDIKFFSELCISFSEYRMANSFINQTIGNNGISPENIIKIKTLHNSIRYAIRKEEAVKLASSGLLNASILADRTHISEVDAIRIIRNLTNKDSQSQDSNEKRFCVPEYK